MKTFSDLLDTVPENQLYLQISPISENGFPEVHVSINGDIVYDGTLQSQWCTAHRFPLMSRLKLEIGLHNKQYSLDKETAVVIDAVRINHFDIIPKWTHLASYINERGINTPVGCLGFNGVWVLETDDCFHRWWHKSTGQGWLLEPKAGSPCCVPSSASTTAKIGRSEL